jgi:RNA polymerase-binding transcription factor DksA
MPTPARPGVSLKEVELTAVKKSPAGTPKAAPAKKAARTTTRAASASKASTAKSSASTGATAKAPTKKAAPAGKSTAKAPAKKAPAAKAPAKKATAPAKSATKTPAAAKPATKTPAAAKTPPAAKPATKTPAAAKATGATKAPAAAKAPVKKAAPEAPKRPTVGPYAKEPKFLDAQRVLLLEERTIYAGQAVDLRAEADSLALEREPGDVQFDEESGEGGTVTVDRERNLALSAQAVLAVEEIDDALTKLDRKTYGYCERCFQPIPKARLQALPFARLCVACKSGGLSRR